MLPEIQYRPFDKRFPLFARCRKSAKISDKMADNENLECDQEISGLTVDRKCADANKLKAVVLLILDKTSLKTTLKSCVN